MPRTQHRIRKHDMKEDSFVTFAFRSQEYIQTHQKTLGIGLAVIVAAVVGVWLISSAGERAETSAEQVLSEAFVRVQQNDMAGAGAVYHRVIDDYGSTTPAREARFYLANLYFVQQQWDDAIAAYTAYLDRHADFDAGRQAAGWAAIGDARQAMDQHTEALDSYEEALAVQHADFLQADILMSAARSAMALQDESRAIGYADQLFELQGNSPAMTNMREMLVGQGVTYLRGF